MSLGEEKINTDYESFSIDQWKKASQQFFFKFLKIIIHAH
jgi:hypothetical protein